MQRILIISETYNYGIYHATLEILRMIIALHLHPNCCNSCRPIVKPNEIVIQMIINLVFKVWTHFGCFSIAYWVAFWMVIETCAGNRICFWNLHMVIRSPSYLVDFNELSHSASCCFQRVAGRWMQRIHNWNANAMDKAGSTASLRLCLLLQDSTRDPNGFAWNPG